MEIKNVLAQIQDLKTAKKYDEIEDMAWDLMEEHSTSIDLFILLGKAALENRNFGRADYYFIKAKMVDKSNTEPLFLLAELSVLIEDFPRARGYYEMILTMEADNIYAKVGFADTLYISNFYVEAAERYIEILESGVKDKLEGSVYALVIYKAASSLLINKENEKGLDLIEKFALEEFNEMVNLAKLKLYQAMGPDYFGQARETLELLHQQIPEQPSYLLQLIPYLDHEEDNQKLEGLYATLFQMQMDPIQQMDSLRMRGEFRIKNSDWKGALSDLDALIEVKEDWNFYQNRAEVKKKLKDFKGALKDLTKAISMTNGKSESLLFDRAKIYVLAKAYDKGIADLQKIISISISNRNVSEAYYDIGVTYTKLKDKSNAIKNLIKAELMGNVKAREFLISKFSDKLAVLRSKSKSKYMEEYASEFDRNGESPIISKAIGKLWVPNMEKVFQELEEDMNVLPGKLIKNILEKESKDLFLITKQAILLIEADSEPMEAFYKVIVESEHSILLQLQASKGGPSTNMRLSLFEGNLLVSYPIEEGQKDGPLKYFINSDKATDDQKERLKAKDLDIPYVETLEESIASLAG